MRIPISSRATGEGSTKTTPRGRGPSPPREKVPSLLVSDIGRAARKQNQGGHGPKHVLFLSFFKRLSNGGHSLHPRVAVRRRLSLYHIPDLVTSWAISR